MPNAVEVEVGFNRRGRPVHFKISLTPALVVQRHMIACLQQPALYEPETSAFVVNCLRPGDTVIDVGAHVGYYTLLAAALVGPTGTVHAFEPEARNVRLLGKNVEDNGAKHVHLHQQVLWSETKEATFYLETSRHDGAHRLFDNDDPDSPSTTKPETLTLRALDDVLPVATLGTVRLLKLDVVGAEAAVLRGAAQRLSQEAVEFVICEFNAYCMARMQTTEADIRDLMAGYGYRLYQITDWGELMPVLDGQTILPPGESAIVNGVFARPEALSTLSV